MDDSYGVVKSCEDSLQCPVLIKRTEVRNQKTVWCTDVVEPILAPSEYFEASRALCCRDVIWEMPSTDIAKEWDEDKEKSTGDSMLSG